MVCSRTSSYRLGVPLLCKEEFEVVIMIAHATEEMHGSDRDISPETDYERALVGMALISTRAKWRSSPSGWSSARKKYLTAPALSERRCFANHRIFVL